MTRQTAEQTNAKRRDRYQMPENQERNAAKRLARYGPLGPDTGPCRPYLGLKFNSKAVQSTLTKWGG